MKYKKTMEETDDSSVYRHAADNILDLRFCPICRKHRGCNRERFGQERNWKKFRNTQYKVE